MEKQDQREVNYQKLLSDMTEKYAVVEDIRNSVDEIQKKMERISIEQKNRKILFYMKKNHLLPTSWVISDLSSK